MKKSSYKSLGVEDLIVGREGAVNDVLLEGGNLGLLLDLGTSNLRNLGGLSSSNLGSHCDSVRERSRGRQKKKGDKARSEM